MPIILMGVTEYSGATFESKLNGFFTQTSQKPRLSREKYLNNDFQSQFDKYLREKIMFREFFIRLHNQILFSCFETTETNQIVGKHGNIFQDPYINTECGIADSLDFSIPNNYLKLTEYVCHLKNIHIKLNAVGKHFLFLVTPSKATLCYNDIPLKYRLRKKKDYKTPYYYLSRLLQDSDLTYIE